jgi:hypothetical protein
MEIRGIGWEDSRAGSHDGAKIMFQTGKTLEFFPTGGERLLTSDCFIVADGYRVTSGCRSYLCCRLFLAAGYSRLRVIFGYGLFLQRDIFGYQVG